MLYGPLIIAVLFFVNVLSPGSAYSKPARHNITYEHDYDIVNKTRQITIPRQNVTEVFEEEPEDLYSGADNTLGGATFNWTALSIHTDTSKVTTTESFGHSDEFGDLRLSGNMLQLSEMHKNNKSSQENITTSNNNESVSTPGTNKSKNETISEKVLSPSKQTISYHKSHRDDEVQTFMLERKKIHLQHHLQLVPMEDKPLDAMMIKNQRYIISVLIPIGVGMVGAAMIVCTVLTLRKVARKRAIITPLDDCAEAERPNTPCISSISQLSTETTDKVFLLLGDDDI